MAPVSYPRALALAALQAALSGSWIAAGELTPARRRLARLGAVAVTTGIGYVISPPSSSSAETPDSPVTLRLVAPGSANALGVAAPELAGSPDAAHPTGDRAPQAAAGPSHGLLDASEMLDIKVPFDKRKAVLGAAVVALSAGAIAGRRQLEKRWLARLTGHGHPHPTRGLAVRMAAVEFAGQFALQLADRRRNRA
ncbi:hypothetical protein Aab01nite_38520 [Paractinoplanes abujensis]|uniref:Uncharacterized protein n=1 Tax=Paractinoplanes abujensis TaxID=882441 RepID=A0A7W7G3C4_9ACTN|nr:hypothetical protein [Actinoplanes abujensis]MBB4694524.1 hypothetical protein [Actinoplanes abujensis]GID20262.1 hypothetical protein Aab01nite_38520 [Actinoplanes abujensis]